MQLQTAEGFFQQLCQVTVNWRQKSPRSFYSGAILSTKQQAVVFCVVTVGYKQAGSLPGVATKIWYSKKLVAKTMSQWGQKVIFSWTTNLYCCSTHLCLILMDYHKSAVSDWLLQLSTNPLMKCFEYMGPLNTPTGTRFACISSTISNDVIFSTMVIKNPLMTKINLEEKHD